MYLFNSSTSKLTLLNSKRNTPRLVAQYILGQALREDDLEHTTEGKIEYLKGWVEHLDENTEVKHQIEYISDVVADHLVYSSSLHILDDNKSEVSNEFRLEVCNSIAKRLDNTFNPELA